LLEGCRREEAIGGLLERHGEKRLSIADVEEVAWELGVSRATLYRLIAAFRAKRTVSSVEPRSRGRRKNSFVFDRAGEGEMPARGSARAGPTHDQGEG
jgi:putative transposase